MIDIAPCSAQVIAPSMHAVISGGVPEMDQELIENMDHCTSMIRHLTHTDLEAIRGRAAACTFLGDKGLLTTDGIALTGSISDLSGAELRVRST